MLVFSTYSRSLLKIFKDVTFLCIDVDVKPLYFHVKRVGNEASNSMYVNASAGYLPFRRNIAKLIIVVSVVEHLANPWKFFEEVTNILDNGGLLFIVTPEPSILNSPLVFYDETHRSVLQGDLD